MNRPFIPQREKIENINWKICNYEDFGNALKKSIGKHKKELSDYHYSLLEDYCKYVLALSELANSWTCDENTSFDQINNPNNLEEIQELGLNDVRQKLLYQQMAEIIKAKVQAKGWKTENCGISEFFNGIGKRTMDICHGITRSVGLVEVKWKKSERVVCGIQVQGEQYRHLIEWKETPDESEKQEFLVDGFLSGCGLDYPKQKNGLPLWIVPAARIASLLLGPRFFSDGIPLFFCNVYQRVKRANLHLGYAKLHFQFPYPVSGLLLCKRFLRLFLCHD